MNYVYLQHTVEYLLCILPLGPYFSIVLIPLVRNQRGFGDIKCRNIQVMFTTSLKTCGVVDSSLTVQTSLTPRNENLHCRKILQSAKKTSLGFPQAPSVL